MTVTTNASLCVEPAALPVDAEKAQLAITDELPATSGYRAPRPQGRIRSFLKSDKMPSFRQFLTMLILGALLTLAYASASSHPNRVTSKQSADDIKFKELLSSVSNDALHEVLHEFVWKKYKHGVYPEDRTAMEAVHQDNAEMATVLIELAKRQAGLNTTLTTSTTPTTSTAVTTSTPLTTSTQPTTTALTSTSTTTSVSPTITSSRSSSTSKPSSTTTSTSSSSTEPSSTSFTSSSPSSIEQASSTAQVIYTTTLPGGARSTVTYVTVVPAGQVASTPGVSVQTAAPSLQTNAAVPTGAARGGMMAAGLGLAGVMIAM